MLPDNGVQLMKKLVRLIELCMKRTFLPTPKGNNYYKIHKDYKIDICCFIVKHTILRCKNTDWLNWLVIRIMCPIWTYARRGPGGSMS